MTQGVLFHKGQPRLTSSGSPETSIGATLTAVKESTKVVRPRSDQMSKCTKTEAETEIEH